MPNALTHRRMIMSTWHLLTFRLFDILTNFKHMKKVLIAILLCCSNLLFAQDIIYTISGEYNEEIISIDSILIENISNGTEILFADLPVNPYYQINLSQRSLMGPVGILDVEKSHLFTEIKNLPGILSLNYNGATQMEAKLSIININGQIMYSTGKIVILPGNSIRVQLSSPEIFLVKLESPAFNKTFKAVGSNIINNYRIEITEGNYRRTELKSTLKSNVEDFSFEVGDSLRIYSFKRGYYASEIRFKVENSQPLVFQFNKNFLK